MVRQLATRIMMASTMYDSTDIVITRLFPLPYTSCQKAINDMRNPIAIRYSIPFVKVMNSRRLSISSSFRWLSPLLAASLLIPFFNFQVGVSADAGKHS